jgi:cytochrome oxidase Cu insertion factor (SCO1/SenC/PrrC family)
MGARPLRLVVLGLALGLVTTMVAGATQPDPFAAMNALHVTPHAPAPDAAFQTLDGRPVRLATLHGRPVLLTFFTTW